MAVYKILLFMIFTIPVYASTQNQFLSLLDQDALGKRIEGSQYCQQELKSLSKSRISNQISNELINPENRIILNNKSSFKISSYTIIDNNPTIYKVNFSVNKIKDHFLVIEHTSKKKISYYGKLEVLSPPQNFYIYQQCLED